MRNEPQSNQSLTGEDILQMIQSTQIMDGKYQKLSASQQRVIFGAYIFGRRQFQFDSKRQKFWVMRIVAFGQDYDVQSYSLDEIAHLVNSAKAGQKIYYGDRITPYKIS